MPLPVQTNVDEVRELLHHILAEPRPPVARCRLLSSGFGPGHMFKIEEDITGSKACLGCGSCMDACPVLAREPQRLRRTNARSSLALETLVGVDCDRCGNCVLACPQVDPTIKHYLVQTHLAEGMAQLLAQATSDEHLLLDLALAEAAQ